MRLYLAAPWEYGPTLLPLRQSLRALGHVVTSGWLNITTTTMSKTRMEATHYALKDLADVDSADMLVLFNPFGEPQSPGRNIEFGYALAKGKMLAIVGQPKGVFQYLPQIKHLSDADDLLYWLSVMNDENHSPYKRA